MNASSPRPAPLRENARPRLSRSDHSVFVPGLQGDALLSFIQSRGVSGFLALGCVIDLDVASDLDAVEDLIEEWGRRSSG